MRQSGTLLPQTSEALTHTLETVSAPGKAVKGGGGARVITVWAGEGVEKEGSQGEGNKDARGTGDCTSMLGAAGRKQSCFVSISKPPNS